MNFSDIEKIEGIKYIKSLDESNLSSLELWYDKIRTVDINNLSVGDLAKAVRQGIYVKYIFQSVFEKLKNDLSAGDLYDGELLASFCAMGSKDFNDNVRLIKLIVDHVKSVSYLGDPSVIDIETISEEISKLVARWSEMQVIQ